MTANRALSIVMILIVLVTAAWVTTMLVSADGGEGDTRDGVVPRWRCPTNIPTPSITASVSDVTTTSARISASYTRVSMRHYTVTHSFYWNDGNRSTSRTVTSEGTYRATVSAVFERDGNICDRSASASVTVEFEAPPTLEPCGSSSTAPTCIPPTPTKPPTPTPTLEPCGSSGTAPTCVPPTPTPTKSPTPTPVTPTPTPGPNPPPAPAWANYSPYETVFSKGLGKGTITMQLIWAEVPGSGITYELLEPVNPPTWRIVKSGITSRAVHISNLQPEQTYTYGVWAVRNGIPSELRKIDIRTPIPFTGRQRDHTVAYQFGVSAPPQGQYVPDHSDAFDKAIKAWNASSAATDSNGPQIHICEVDVGDCNTRNTDGYSAQYSVLDGDLADRCSGSYACVSTPRTVDGRYIGNRTVRIEEPAYFGEDRIVWTNNFNLHNKPVPDKAEWTYSYLRNAIMHEFGHMLGLADLYKLTYRDFSGYLMGDTRKRGFEAIPTLDNDYLEDIYRNHKRR